MLDAAKPEPLYSQLREQLRRAIEGGDLPVGGQLPTENELLQQYGVSRATVRQAVLELVRQGYLYRHRGRGTFVARQRPLEGIESLVSFTAEMTARGVVAGAVVLSLRQGCAPPADVAARLGLAPGARVIHSRRLRTADGQPLALEDSWLNEELVGALKRAELAGSLYQALVHRRGLRIGRAMQTVTPAVADAALADLLGIAPGAPVLRLERVTYLDDGRPLEAMSFAYRGDIYKLETEIRRDGR